MSIERRIISSLQSALRAGPLLPGEELDTPYVISSLDGRLMDCNSFFSTWLQKMILRGLIIENGARPTRLKKLPTRFTLP